MRLDSYGQRILERTLARSAGPRGVQAAPAEPAEARTATPAFSRAEDINRSILAASLSQIENDMRITRLMFEPVDNVRRAQ